MSDGLFQQDPSYKVQRSAPQPDRQESSPATLTLNDLQEQTSARIREIEPSSDGQADDTAVSVAAPGVSAPPAASEPPQFSSANEAPWPDGLTQEQPAHHPGAVPVLRSVQPGESDYVPPSQTEAPLSFRIIGQIYSALTGPTAIALAVAIGGLLALYVYFQVIALLATLATLPRWLAAIAVVLLGLLIAVVVLAFGRLVVAYSRLRRNEQIRMGDIQQLEHHAQIRRGCSPSQQRQQAKTVLEIYVREYPQYPVEKTAHHHPTPTDASSTSHQVHPQQTSPFSADELRRLYRTQRRLADPARIKDSKEWMNVYATEFQSVLDSAARERVHQCAKWVGYKTAISPSPLVDTFIAAYWCFVLLRDLCLIYNVRVGAYGTAALLWRAFFTAYLAGRFQDWEDHADYTVEAMMDGLPEIGRKIAGKLAAKAGDGLANYFMVRRLGKRAIALLRPLAVEPQQ